MPESFVQVEAAQVGEGPHKRFRRRLVQDGAL